MGNIWFDMFGLASNITFLRILMTTLKLTNIIDMTFIARANSGF